MQNPYDEVPYGEFVHSASHPGKAAAIATLLGLSPQPIDHCRVLELGCAGGSNLLPWAVQFPHSQFVGVDYSLRQIQAGQARIAELGLNNMTLHALDVREMDKTFGQFDYIIAHGLYSWVSADVREHVVRLCKELLSPSGIVYMSYNTYPGWHMLQVGREAMLFHTRHLTDPQERAQQGRDFIQFLSQTAPTEEDSLWGGFMQHYKGFMEIQALLVNQKPINVLMHDELEAVNEPCYFTDFIQHAGRHGLQYLSEVNFATVMTGSLPKQAAERLQQMTTSVIEREQYIDFVRNRTFRQTLLVHEDIVINRRLEPQRLAALYLSSSAARADMTSEEQKPGAQKYLASDDIAFITSDPFIKTMFDVLIAQSPLSLRLDDLADRVMTEMAKHISRLPKLVELQQHLATQALMAYTRSGNLIDLQAHAPTFTTAISDHPRVSPLTLQQVRQENIVTTALHENVRLDDFVRGLASLLDGTRTLKVLQEDMMRMIKVPDGQDVESWLRTEIEVQLQWFARNALLIS